MKLRIFLLHSLSVAVGFAIGGATFQPSNAQPSMQLEVSGMTDSRFADLKAKHDISELPWISPSEAVSHCELKKFKVMFGSEGTETIAIPLDGETVAGVACVFELATYPTKHTLTFHISQH